MVHQSSRERNFHVFYQLLRGCEPSLLTSLALTRAPEEYAYLAAAAQHTPPGAFDDVSDWARMLEALHIIGVSQENQT